MNYGIKLRFGLTTTLFVLLGYLLSETPVFESPCQKLLFNLKHNRCCERHFRRTRDSEAVSFQFPFRINAGKICEQIPVGYPDLPLFSGYQPGSDRLSRFFDLPHFRLGAPVRPDRTICPRSYPIAVKISPLVYFFKIKLHGRLHNAGNARFQMIKMPDTGYRLISLSRLSSAIYPASLISPQHDRRILAVGVR